MEGQFVFHKRYCFKSLKTPPSRPQAVPRCLQDASSCIQEKTRELQEAFKTPQGGSSSRWTPESSKSLSIIIVMFSFRARIHIRCMTYLTFRVPLRLPSGSPKVSTPYSVRGFDTVGGPLGDMWHREGGPPPPPHPHPPTPEFLRKCWGIKGGERSR